MPCVTLLGQRLSARDFDRQVAEFQVGVAVLNGFTALGIPAQWPRDTSVWGNGNSGLQKIRATEPMAGICGAIVTGAGRF